jgi:hypothetical protein
MDHMSTLPQTTPWGDDTPVGVRLKAATGTSDVVLQEALIRQLQEAMPASTEVLPLDRASLGDAAVAALTALGPRDAIEGMLGVMIVAAQFTAMDRVKRASDLNQTLQVQDVNLRHAERLMLIWDKLHERFDRRRGRGPASVNVGNLLNVGPGGQAVVNMDAKVGRIEADAGAPSLAQEHPLRGTGDAGEASSPVVDDERIRRSPVPMPQDERIRGLRRERSDQRTTHRG